MVEIKKAITKKDIKAFVNFQPQLYKGNKYYVPPLLCDEINILTPGKSPYLVEDADLQCFLAYKNGKLVGRGAGIIQHQYNKKHNCKRARFSRLDFIDDQEVATALITAIENWAKEKGMDTIHGPLGFNDLERQGLQIEGFDYLSTFEMQYNYPYYQKLIENNGYQKEADWIEYVIKIPEKLDERNTRLNEAVQRRTGLKEVRGLSKKELIKRYAEQILDCVDEAYGKLYGTVPLSKYAREGIIEEFKLILDTDFISVLIDKDDNVGGFGLALPSLSKAVQKGKGKLFPFGFIHLLHALKHNDTVDLALICVRDKYAATGATSIIFHNMLQRFIDRGIKYAESNAQLENNYKVQALFKKIYETKDLRRRRCYVKELK